MTSSHGSADSLRGVIRLAKQADATLAGAGLSLSQYRVLDRLAGGHAVGKSLADWLAVKPPSVTVLIDGLVARGLVARTADPDDRRRVSHMLTHDGRVVYEAASASLLDRLERVIAHLPDPVVGRQMMRALADWNDALEHERLSQSKSRPAAAKT